MEMITKQVQQRFPLELLEMIDEWSTKMGITRTASINIMCYKFFEENEVLMLREVNQKLITKIVELAMSCKREG